MLGQLGRAIATAAALLLGAAVGAYLAFCVGYLVVEPAERDAGNALLVAVLVILLVALAFVARKASGSLGLTGLALVVLLGAVGIGWVTL